MSSLELTLDRPGAGTTPRPPHRSTPIATAARATAQAPQPYKPAGRSPVGIGIVVGAHVLLGWALVSGLARTVVDVIKAPIETRLIEEIKPPPPPPPPPVERVQPPKAVKPPPAYVPPPEVQVTPPPQPAPTITTTQVAPPPAEPVVVAAPAPVAPPAPPKPIGTPARIDVSSCEKPAYPDAAARVEATGTTKIRFAVDASGAVSKADVERASGGSREHRLLDRAAVLALSKCRFKPGLDENGSPVGGFAIVDYVWKLD